MGKFIFINRAKTSNSCFYNVFNRNILKENIINLRHILGKAGIACKNNYTSYQRLCKRDKKIVSVIYFNSFSLNYQIVKDNIKDHTMLEELVSKDYKKYINRKTSKKIIRLFLYEEIKSNRGKKKKT